MNAKELYFYDNYVKEFLDILNKMSESLETISAAIERINLQNKYEDEKNY